MAGRPPRCWRRPPRPKRCWWCARRTTRSTSWIPGSGLRLASVSLGHAPHEVSVSPDGRRAVGRTTARASSRDRRSASSTSSSRASCGASTSRRTRRPHGVAWYRAGPDCRHDRRLAAPAASSIPTPAGSSSAIETGQEVSHMVAVERRRAAAPTSPTSARARRRRSTWRRAASSPTSPPARARRHSRSTPGRPRTVGRRARGRADGGRRYGHARGDGAPAAPRHPDPDRDHARRPHRAGHLRRHRPNSSRSTSRPAANARRARWTCPLAPGAAAAAVRPPRPGQRAAGRPAGLRATAAAPTSRPRWAIASSSSTRRTLELLRSDRRRWRTGRPGQHARAAARDLPRLCARSR